MVTLTKTGRKGFTWLILPQPWFITEGGEDRNSNREGAWRQELMQRPLNSAAYWLAPHGSLGLLCYIAQDGLPRDATTHSKLGSTVSVIIKKCSTHQTFSKLRSLFQITLVCA